MNTRDLMEAKLKERGGVARLVPPPETLGTPPADGEDDLRETVTEAAETLDVLVEQVLRRLLRKATDEKSKVAITKVAVAYLSVQHRAPMIFGADLDAEEESA